MAEMTPALVRDLCKKNGGYTQPKLNDQLFLQCQGFSRIENLEPYTAAKVLWLEQNAIDHISGLNEQANLVSLFLHNNVIRTISGLQCLGNLRILNLSHNYISRIENIHEYCPLLETLQISHNRISSLEDACGELLLFKHLSSIDLSFNKIDREQEVVVVVMPPSSDGIEIEDEEEEEDGGVRLAPSKGASERYDPNKDPFIVVNFFKRIQELSVLYLQGNPLVHGLRHYRKQMVANIPKLTYLDERPIFPEERRATEAWAVGGNDAESEERHRIRKEKHDHLTACVSNLAKMAEATRELRAQRTLEYEEKRKEGEKTRLAMRRQTAAAEDDEDDARILVQYEQSAAWVELCEALGDELRQAEVEEEARRIEEEDRRRMQALVDADVARENRHVDEIIGLGAEGESMMRRMLEAHAARTEEATRQLTEDPEALRAKEEMRFWLRQMELSDEEVVGQMESDMLDMLRTMTPGSFAARPSTTQGQEAAAPPRAISSSSSSAPSDMNKEKSAAQFSKERVWDQYDRWERAARARFLKQ